MIVNLAGIEPLDYAGNEAINTLCTNLSFAGRDKKIIMITSCQASEGKTFLALNLLRSLARLGKRVVLVDADLRRSVMNARLGLRMGNTGNGLAHYLAGMCTYSEIVYQTNIPNAFVIPVGRTVTNSLALLSTPLLGEMLNAMANDVDYVLVDAPPVGAIIDPAEIAKSCDGALIVVTHNKVSRVELGEAKRQIEASGCLVLGAVLNGVDFDTIGSKKYYYKRRYGTYGSDVKDLSGDSPMLP